VERRCSVGFERMLFWNTIFTGLSGLTGLAALAIALVALLE